MEGACSKRKPATQLTKDSAYDEEPHAEIEPTVDHKEADADTLKNRRRLKIVRTHAPPASVNAEQQLAKEKQQETKAESPAAPHEEQEPPAAAAAAAAGASESAPLAAEATKPAAVEGSGSSEAAAAAAEPAAANGETAADSSSSSSAGFFGGVLKGASAFVSPFGSLGAAGSSFLLPSGGTPGGPSLFGGPLGGPSGGPATDTEADVPPPEEPTVVTTSVDSKEEVIFSDRDCRMQCFDVENRQWTPKPPLDGKVDFVVPKKGEEEGLPVARILFFMNRTGRLRLNSPVLPSSVKFRHPVERAAISAAAKAVAAPAAAATPKSEAAANEENKEVPLKTNTVEFTGLKIDASNSKDTTFYRIRFSSDERATEFMALANAKQEEATKAAQPDSSN